MTYANLAILRPFSAEIARSVILEGGICPVNRLTVPLCLEVPQCATRESSGFRFLRGYVSRATKRLATYRFAPSGYELYPMVPVLNCPYDLFAEGRN